MNQNEPTEAVSAHQSGLQATDGGREGRGGQRVADGREGLRGEIDAWRHKAVRRAITISRLQGTIQAVVELASEETTARTEWGNGYRDAIADLRDLLREFGHLPPAPAHNAGPTVAECAAQDRAYWERKDAGEGQ